MNYLPLPYVYERDGRGEKATSTIQVEVICLGFKIFFLLVCD